MSRQDAKQQVIHPANVAEAADISADLTKRGIGFVIAFTAAGGISIRILDADVQLSN